LTPAKDIWEAALGEKREVGRLHPNALGSGEPPLSRQAIAGAIANDRNGHDRGFIGNHHRLDEQLRLRNPANDISIPGDIAKERNAAGQSNGAANDKPSGMMGFLSRKKGRDRSPKPTERGVLGRGNVRQVVGNR
jgi:hypothetical protein